VEVEGEGGVVVAKVDEDEDVVFFLKKTFDEGKGVPERGRVEEGGRHCKGEVGSKKACWLSCEC